MNKTENFKRKGGNIVSFAAVLRIVKQRSTPFPPPYYEGLFTFELYSLERLRRRVEGIGHSPFSGKEKEGPCSIRLPPCKNDKPRVSFSVCWTNTI